MIIKFIKWFQGYLLVVIKGYSPERFINLCSARNILLWNLKKTEKGYEFYISIRGFKDLKSIVRKTRTQPYILNRIGLPFLLYKNKKRKGFFLGILIFFSLLYLLSLHIWDIGITGQYTHTEEAMLKYLSSIEVYSGVRKSKLNCQEIEESIRKEYPDIGWVSAEIRGTRLLIKITETNMPVPYEEATVPSHIISSRDAIVKSIVTRKGVPLVKKGMVVKKGDILVSGVIDIFGDFEELKQKETVVADADIILKSYYKYHSEFPLEYMQKEYTQESFRQFGVSILGKNIFFYNPIKKMKSYENYDIIVNENQLKLNKSFYLPLKWMSKDYLEYVESKKKYTREEAIKKAKTELESYMKKLNEKGVLIIQNNVKILIDSSKCTASGKLIVEEMEKAHRKIKDSEWRIIETDEHSGDNH